MIVLHASFPIDPDRREDAIELIDTLVDKSNEEDGMIDYRATIDIQDEHMIRFIERYEDEAAFEAHTQTEHFQTFEERLPELLAGDPEILRFDVSDVTDLEV
ncbi:MAG: putative quinol monooxygenase [Halobacteriales archaeon]